MTPDVTTTITTFVSPLVYGAAAAEYFSSLSSHDGVIELSRRPEAPLTAKELAAAVAHKDVLAAEASGEVVRLHLRDASAAEGIDLNTSFLEAGAFRVASHRPGQMILQRRLERRPDQPAAIEIIDVGGQDEEWRRFMAGEIDIIPVALPGAMRQLRSLEHVRAIPVGEPTVVALWFRMDSGPTADRDLRAHIASVISRRGLVRLLGSGEARGDIDEQKAILSAPQPALRLVTYTGYSDLVRVAMALEQQLGAVGIALTIESLPMTELIARISARAFDLALVPGDLTSRYWHRLPFYGYAPPDFTVAVAAGDEAAVKAILDRDLPLTPLFSFRELVVTVDRVCDVHPRASNDLSWLADVRWCHPGEVN
jgi:ABC-type transport system substrate-binding protein